MLVVLLDNTLDLDKLLQIDDFGTHKCINSPVYFDGASVEKLSEVERIFLIEECFRSSEPICLV